MMAADITYQDIIAAGAAGLAESEFWVIDFGFASRDLPSSMTS